MGQDRVRSLVRIVLGKIEDAEGASEAALAHWREAASVARRLNDKSLRFKAELFLYKHAIGRNDALSTRAIERRLQRMASWLPPDEDEVQEFRTLVADQPVKKRKRVAMSQRSGVPESNPQSR